jgi:hypothetical protein
VGLLSWVRRVVSEALREDSGVKGAVLGLRIIEAVDPPMEATISFDRPKSPKEIDAALENGSLLNALRAGRL